MDDKRDDSNRRPSPLGGEGTDEGTGSLTLPSPPLGKGGRELTPLMQQYHDLKSRYPEEVLRVVDALQTDALCPANWHKGQPTLTPSV